MLKCPPTLPSALALGQGVSSKGHTGMSLARLSSTPLSSDGSQLGDIYY